MICIASSVQALDKMKPNERQNLTLKCECTVSRDNLTVNTKKKSKFSTLTLNMTAKVISVQPYGQAKEAEILSYPLSKLHSIQHRFIEEGKLTLDFFEKSERVQMRGVDVSSADEMRKIYISIMISNASKENLELLLSHIKAIKKVEKVQNQSKLKQNERKSVETPPQSRKRKGITEIDQQQLEKLSRNDLRRMATDPSSALAQSRMVSTERKRPIRVDLMKLPASILNNIFEYCRMELYMRTVSRQFSDFVVRHITSIRLHDEVDEVSFNNLCKWAINVDCRMKNVRSINLMDKNEHPELISNRAKTLKFGGWKEITTKNIMQLKGLRIYSLQLPYHIKFDLTHLFGLRLVELRFKSTTHNSRNELIKSEDLAYILKHTPQLKALELPYCQTNLFKMIQHPQRLEAFSVRCLSDNCKEEEWTIMTQFTKMKRLALSYLEKQGTRKEKHEQRLKMPKNLLYLEIGGFLSDQSLQELPLSIEHLKLVGQSFFSHHIEQIYLPNVRMLDIAESINVRMECLYSLQNIDLITNWSRHSMDSVKNFAEGRMIRLSTVSLK